MRSEPQGANVVINHGDRCCLLVRGCGTPYTCPSKMAEKNWGDPNYVSTWNPKANHLKMGWT